MLQGEEGGVDEDEPAHHSQDDQAIPEWGLIQIENLPRVKVELLAEEKSHVHDDIGADEYGHFDSGHLPQPRPRHSVPLGQQDQEQ